MRRRIDNTTKSGQVPEEVRKKYKGFQEWNLVSTRHDHQTILQILVDGRDNMAMDIEEQPLPTLVYLAREKRPQYHHNFKAGALNALTSQYFDNLTMNDAYGSSLRVITEVEFPGMDGSGGPLYGGNACFHRRDALLGMKYRNDYKADWMAEIDKKVEESALVLEQKCKVLATCNYEENTEWGKEEGPSGVEAHFKLGEQLQDLEGLKINFLLDIIDTVMMLHGLNKSGFAAAWKVAEEYLFYET
ncbi:hypothetical protein U1Q18_008729 [Sarracenia purpurea var. burkii]